MGDCMALEIPMRNNNLVQKSISFIGPPVWNKLSNDQKLLNNATSFTQDYQKLVLKKPE